VEKIMKGTPYLTIMIIRYGVPLILRGISVVDLEIIRDNNANRSLLMSAVTFVILLLALVGSYLLYFAAPRSGRVYRFGIPFRHAAASPAIWRKSNRFAGACLLLSCLFIVVPPFIWGFGTAVQLFTLLIWGLVLLPLLTLTAYAYSLLLFLNEKGRD
jgi:hypothetical protein